MACQLDKDFHLGFPVTWMGEVFPSIASSAPHKLVMVAIHQSYMYFKFVFLSIVHLANGLQHFCRLQICHLSKQQHLEDLKSIGSLSPESNPVPMLSQKVISFEEAHPYVC